MPTYLSENNNTLNVISPNGYVQLNPGRNELSFYLKALPSGVTFVSHDPVVTPYNRLIDATSFPSNNISVFAYTTLIVANKTNSVCVIYANRNNLNTFEVAAGTTLTIDNKQDWGTLTLHSAGTGTVSVWGIV